MHMFRIIRIQYRTDAQKNSVPYKGITQSDIWRQRASTHPRPNRNGRKIRGGRKLRMDLAAKEDPLNVE